MAPCTRNSARNAQQEPPDKQGETQMADFSINLEKLATVSMWTAIKNNDSDGEGFLLSESNDSEFTPDTEDEELALDMDEQVSISSDQEYEQEYTVRSKKKREREGNRFGKIHIDLDKFMQKDEEGKELKSNASDWDGLNKRQKFSKKDSCPLNWEKWEKELEKWDAWKSNGDVNSDGLAKKKGPLDFMEPSADILMPLLPFQKEWLAWSIQQERGESKGGILADEMGMGKTIQAIALVLTARALRHVNCDSPNPPVDHCSKIANSADPKLLPHVKGTLVVCPLVAVIQWKSEISKFTAEGSTKVLVYHGAARYKHVADLANYDFILTTYATIEAEYRKVANPSKRQCPWCGKTFLPRSLKLHLKHFCGPDAVKTEKQAKQVKKKVHSSYNSNMKKKVLKDDEDSEVEIFTEKKMGKFVRGKKLDMGSKKATKRFDIIQGDIPASAKGYTQKPSEQISSPLHSVEWERIILDEAHCIKDRRCNTSKAVFSLHSSYKWALSGTPLQNRVGELYSLVRFLQIFPYSYYFCKSCECKSLDYSFGAHNRECDHCHHSPLSHFCWWNKYVANPITKHGYKDQGKKALILLKHKVLNQIVLRRTKTERAADLALPPKATFLRRDTFDAREEDFYQALYTQSRSQFNTYVAADTVVNNYAHIFDLLTRLRQAVDHPYLVVYSRTSVTLSNNENTSSVISECPLCHDQLDDPVTAQCGHSFCRVCIQSHPSRPGEATTCPSCSKPLTVDLTERTNTQTEDLMKKSKGSGILSRLDLKNFQTSTKIDALREEICLMLQRDASAKAIVFSQFTSFLDLISFSLSKSGIKYVQLTGNMSIQARDQAIEKFTNDSEFKVFLMSLKAGGVALNLTVASHVFLMDPWWNPAVEQQAQDRIHRLGQYKPIRVVRFVIANTIEERILRLQEKKDLVFKGTVGRSEEALGRLTVDDLRFLFTN